MRSSSEPVAGASPETFRTTRWTTVLRAGRNLSGDGQQALERLCTDCWGPVYFFIRRLGHREDDARDLTQGFFAHFLQRDYLRAADPERGRFRSFLLASVKHFLAHEWEKARRLKRGGGVALVSWDELGDEADLLELPEPPTPEKSYDQRWALALLHRALTRLREDYEQSGKGPQFACLKQFLSRESQAGDYEAVSGQIGMTVRAVTVAVSRLRQRFAEMAREEVADTVANADDVDDELRYLVTLSSA